jgi:8-oxo-dGTP pyrophosphatase MutT (NUDIX family)
MRKHLAVVAIDRTKPARGPLIWMRGIYLQGLNLQQAGGEFFLRAHTSGKPTPKPSTHLQAKPNMPFSRKIYYNNKPLILTADASSYKAHNPTSKGYLTLTGAFPRNYRMAFQHLNAPRTYGAIIEDISEEALLSELHKIYEPIDAAGGIVEDEAGRVLMIYRRGRWDLPKGKRDDGEAMDECALREVSEETGLHHISLAEKVCDTYHIYAQRGQQLLKTTAWYRMKGEGAEELHPQAEENIQEARWIAQQELGPIVFKSYEAIREVLETAGYKW